MCNDYVHMHFRTMLVKRRSMLCKAAAHPPSLCCEDATMDGQPLAGIPIKKHTHILMSLQRDVSCARHITSVHWMRTAVAVLQWFIVGAVKAVRFASNGRSLSKTMRLRRTESQRIVYITDAEQFVQQAHLIPHTCAIIRHFIDSLVVASF